jgi:FtsP/CotA-like multicopper oxidase with cupredoxin domain
MPEAIATTASRERAHDPKGNHAMDDMAGLVLGLAVRPRRGAAIGASATEADTRPRRAIDIFADERPDVFNKNPGYGFVVKEGARAPAPDSIRIPGTPLILTRGEPVRIAVHNRLPTPISVHWHGIELDSYFDGVGGFSGSGRRIAPMIAPNDSFVVRFTPPRAGTFMYHVHGERGDELASGLYAPLIVVESGAAFDPRTEHIFVLADGGPGEGNPIFVNGTAAPDTMELMAGRTYRLRMIFITANDVVFTTLRGPSGPAMAKVIAADGHDVPAGSMLMVPVRFPTGPGHTRDMLFTASVPGDYVLDVVRRLNVGSGVTIGPTTTVPIRVRAP